MKEIFANSLCFNELEIIIFETKKQFFPGIALVEGAGVPKSDLIGLSDPYCIFSLSGEPDKQTSKYIDNTEAPKWNESFTFFVKDDNQKLHIDLMDKDIPPKKDDLLASIDIPISSFPPGQEVEKWYNLKTPNGKGNPKIHLLVTFNKGRK